MEPDSIEYALHIAELWHKGKMVGAAIEDDEIIDLLYQHILDIGERMLELEEQLWENPTL